MFGPCFLLVFGNGDVGRREDGRGLGHHARHDGDNGVAIFICNEGLGVFDDFAAEVGGVNGWMAQVDIATLTGK